MFLGEGEWAGGRAVVEWLQWLVLCCCFWWVLVVWLRVWMVGFDFFLGFLPVSGGDVPGRGGVGWREGCG